MKIRIPALAAALLAVLSAAAGAEPPGAASPGQRSSLADPAAPPPPPDPVPPAGPAATPAPSTARPAPAQSGFLVKFNNADLYEVIHTLGRIAGINYLIDPRVRGVVNVHTQGSVRKEDALELLLAVLRVNGATAVEEKGIYHIVPMAEARTEPLLPLEPGETGAPAEAGPANRPVMRAFPLQFIAAAEMAKVVKPFLSAGGEATEVPRANIILVTDTAANMEKHARLVELFDADAFRGAGVKLFPLRFIDPEEMAKSLESIFGALDFASKGGKPSGINFVPIVRLNALLAVTTSPRAMENVARWVAELDRETAALGRTVRVYRVRHGKAKDVTDILEKLFPGKTSAVGAGKPTEFKPAVAQPAGQPVTAALAAARGEAPKPEAKPPEAAAAPKKEGEGFDIILDEPLNAVVIRGTASEYAALLDVLRTIDIYPKQILLEVLIAEVQLGEGLRLGVDWTYTNQGGTWGSQASLVTSAAGLNSGLKYVLEKTDRLQVAFRALANEGKISVLSSPSVISTNGKKSKIDVADQVPIVTGTVTTTGGEPFVTETIEYRDVGIILSFTPFINDEGIVTLDIEQEVSDVKETTSGATKNPTFFKRSINTTLIATQDRSIVLGGLVRERRSQTADGIPFLYKIPFIGWIFGGRENKAERTELLIFITPRVIASIEEGSRLSREFEDRVEELKKRIEESGVRLKPYGTE